MKKVLKSVASVLIKALFVIVIALVTGLLASLATGWGFFLCFHITYTAFLITLAVKIMFSVLDMDIF